MTAAASAALGVSRASVQRRRARLAASPASRRPRSRPARALTSPQQQNVLDLLHASRFADQAPAEIYTTLLGEGAYYCSIRTMYRILGRNGEVREQLSRPVYLKPELLAERPNEVWSWDITKLMGPAKWSYFCLYIANPKNPRRSRRFPLCCQIRKFFRIGIACCDQRGNGDTA
jgi:putative transposase